MNVVTLKYDQKWEALEWAKEHCKSYITNDIHRYGPHQNVDYDRETFEICIDYFFSSERDALIFALKWGHQQ